MLLLLSCFSRVRLCATPERAAHQAPPSLGFSRQEHWSGLPFPSPMHESESEVAQSCHDPHGLQPTRVLCPRDFPGKSTRVGCHCLLQRKVRWAQKGFTLFFLIYLAVLGLSWGTQDRKLRHVRSFSRSVWDLQSQHAGSQLRHMGSRSLTKDRTPAPCIGRAES